MKCECGTDTKTKDTRKIEQGIWRRRFCPSCGKEFTTIEQRCETVSGPYASKTKAEVVAPVAPTITHPHSGRRGPVKVASAPSSQQSSNPVTLVPGNAPADVEVVVPKVRRGVAPVIPPQTDKTYPKPKVVDRLTPSARDRIEDMKFEREQKGHGWDK